MRAGFVRVPAGTPGIIVVNPKTNAKEISSLMKRAADAGCKLPVLPKLCLTAATYIFQQALISGAMTR